jgi:hypothetical protein
MTKLANVEDLLADALRTLASNEKQVSETTTEHTKPVTAHTPGPWRVHNHAHVHTAAGRRLATTKGEFGNPANSANARLMSAAPAQAILLDLLQQGLATIAEGEIEFDGVMYWFDHSSSDWATQVVDAIGWDHARAAIAEASGA